MSGQGTVRRLAAALAATALAGPVLAGLVLAGPVLAGLLLAVPPAPAAAAEPCVGVVVDARLLGGGMSTGCATGDPDSGLEALTKAGYGYAFVPRQPGQVCQIDGAPACSDTSTDTYWSYWWRAKGSSRWVYATEGAATHDPAPGATEAWVWQDGGRREPPDIPLRQICPQVAEPRTSTAAPSPDRTTSRAPSPKQSSAEAAGAATSGRTSSSRSPEPTATPTPTPSPTSSTASPSTTSAPADSSPAATPGRTAAASQAAADDGGSAVPWAGVALGGGLIAVFGGAALARSRRGGAP